MVAARFEQVGMNEGAMGGQFWGIGGGRDGLLFAGASMVPLAGDSSAMRSFAHVAARRGRKCATILGPAELVMPLWERLEPRWGPARDVRADQPLMACPGDPLGPLDPEVRLVRSEELESYFPAAIAMFTEEVGVDPRAGDNGRAYRARIAELIGARRAYARFDGETVMFKAEVGSLSNTVALIQGVWVHPQLRGRGLAAPAMAVGGAGDPARHAPGAEPLRQPVQPGGQAHLRPDRLPPGRHLRLCAVLSQRRRRVREAAVASGRRHPSTRRAQPVLSRGPSRRRRP